MAREPHVLIVSTKLDLETDVVVRSLGKRGIWCTRLNTEDLPFEATLTTSFAMRGGPPSVLYCSPGVPSASLDGVTSIWHRRVRVPQPPAEMGAGVYDFCLRESRAALLGALLTRFAPIMSPPKNIWAAEQKPFQLAAARASSLVTPETVISNDPAQIRAAFVRFEGKMVAKPVRTGFVDYGDEQHAIYTSQVLEEHLADLESARWSPAIYQPLIDKQSDVRVTVVGDKLFAAEIDSQQDPSARIDWRRTENSVLPHRPVELPPAVREGVHRLMSALGLLFGAIDFLRTRDGDWIFLEINPNGQWLWLDDTLDLGISNAVATWLAGESSQVSR